ncbi:pyridoxamine 5'-phosphate oxidase family protein [Pelagibaculum spongiae]|uniref:Heme utilization protein HutZ n=1 Tax=Pelagibaculum spongiae TaxID=2080658 RepID=A0A2V1GZG5_9GAMM|nr:pyridoxamine 5'-phosphate oxidase family protein [Pelagibaculum spongiae]PVZ70344.1 heme utilization protein HutZ [Pelagibaculum spongiae]
MKNQEMEQRLSQEILDFIGSRKSLQLSTVQADGHPFASYAPFAIGEQCLYILISEIARHAVNLQHEQRASVLIIEDEDAANEIFARLRVNYLVDAELIEYQTTDWQVGINTLAARHGDRINSLSQLADFRLFRLLPKGGRYVKGFGKAYQLEGGTLAGQSIDHLRVGHKKRS